MKSSAHQRSGAPATSAAKQRPPRAAKENVDPNNPPMPLEPSPLRPPSATKPLAARNRSPLPLRPLKRKLSSEPPPETGAPPPPATAPDSGVQVIVRIRPPSKQEHEGEPIARRISTDSISLLDHAFTFDAVADAGSTQEDIFRLVGLPLVENCLVGFNSSIFAYGQTGGGKTYTMWGPTSALLEDESNIEWGLTPRVFQQLFTRINEEQVKNSDKHLSYQSRCSFLEIYNEQITDLLDPTQKNLQIREDVKNGVYVDYLTEELVNSVKDVIQLLTKGLANRRTGATGVNAESSRSHCVFTCIVESHSKSTTDGLSSFRTSKINLVDLAGSERQKLTGAEGERLKEAGNINRSLSQIGNLINILAEVSQSGKQRHIPYRDSKLTFLLQDSLGGNAKLAMICAISASQSCQNETISTLRFAQNAKAIKTKAIVNEARQDDVSVLREQIRQLKDELLRVKSNGTSSESNESSTGWNDRRSLSLLRHSLNRPSALSVVEEDSDEEMEIDEDNPERPLIQADTSCEENKRDVHKVHSENPNERKLSSPDPELVLVDTSLVSVVGSGCGDQAGGSTDDSAGSYTLKKVEPVQVTVEGCDLVDMSKGLICSKSSEKGAICTEDSEKVIMVADELLDNGSTVLVNDGKISPTLQSSSLSTSPRVQDYSRKSLRTSISSSASQENKSANVDCSPGILSLSFAGTLSNVSLNASAQRDNSRASTEHLEANLLRGLQAIDDHQRSSSLRRSSFRFPIKSVDLSSLVPVKKVDVGIQTLDEESDILGDPSILICNNCGNQASPLDYKDANNEMVLQLIPSDGSQLPDKYKKHVPKIVEKVLTGAIRREMALEDHCAKQAAEILHLNRLVQQYKHERECSAIIEQTREDKIARLEGLMDGTLPTEEFMEEEFISLRNEHNILKEKYENHPEVLRMNIELTRVQNELDEYRNFYDLGEREVLKEEIQDLRSQLKFYMTSSHTPTRSQSPLLKLTQSNGANLSPPGTVSELTEEYVNEKLKEERRYWTETESRWISISEELRIELETSRSLAEKRKFELDCEQKCTEELKEALETAMQGHARLLDQYADLQEKHIALLGRHGQISNGIEDVKKATAKAGIKGAAYRFVKSLAAEISAMKAEKEKERQQLRGENKRLQAQVRDTAEAVQAAGELLVRLKEAEEAATVAQRIALEAEEKIKKADEEIDMMKKNYERQICMLNQFLAESRLPKEALKPTFGDADVAKYGGGSVMDPQYTSDFEPFLQSGGDTELSHESMPCSWFSGYDQCNI